MINLDEIDRDLEDFKGLTEAERALFKHITENMPQREKMEVARGIVDYLFVENGRYDNPKNIPEA